MGFKYLLLGRIFQCCNIDLSSSNVSFLSPSWSHFTNSFLASVWSRSPVNWNILLFLAFCQGGHYSSHFSFTFLNSLKVTKPSPLISITLNAFVILSTGSSSTSSSTWQQMQFIFRKYFGCFAATDRCPPTNSLHLSTLIKYSVFLTKHGIITLLCHELGLGPFKLIG